MLVPEAGGLSKVLRWSTPAMVVLTHLWWYVLCYHCLWWPKIQGLACIRGHHPSGSARPGQPQLGWERPLPEQELLLGWCYWARWAIGHISIKQLSTLLLAVGRLESSSNRGEKELGGTCSSPVEKFSAAFSWSFMFCLNSWNQPAKVYS